MGFADFLEELSSGDAPVRATRLIRLSGMDEEERSALASAWPGWPESRRVDVLERALDLAEDNPELDFDALFRNALSDEAGSVRRLAIEGLWEYEGRDLIPPLAEMLRSDADPSVRGAAALALGRFLLRGEYGELRATDNDAVFAALSDAYRDQREIPGVRGRSLEALGASTRAGVRALIEDAYESGEPELTRGALHAMGRSADSVWLPTLIDELRSGDPVLRFEAAGALGQIEDADAVPYLEETIDDEDPEVQEAAIRALGEIGDDEARAVLTRRLEDDDERIRDAAADALERAELGEDPLSMRLS